MGHNVDMKVSEQGDDWETDPDFEVPTLPGSLVPAPVPVEVTAGLLLPRFRTTCRRRSRGGAPRPSRGLDAKSTSGGPRTSAAGPFLVRDEACALV